MIEVKEVNPVKPIDRVVDIIKNNNFSSEDCEKIFAALREQEDVLYGKMVTMKDIDKKIKEEYSDEIIPLPSDAEDAIKKSFSESNIDSYIGEDLDEAIEDAIYYSEATIHVRNIEWDTRNEDGEDEEGVYDLPENVDIKISDLKNKEDIADYLSDTYYFCVIDPGDIE